MVKILQQAVNARKAKEALASEDGARLNLFAGSAEGMRASVDQNVATDRAVKVLQRVLNSP